MPLNIIEDEKQFYREYIKQLREQTKVAISIHGISDEHRIEIENGLREFLAAEVIKQAHDELRARGVSEEFLDKGDFRSSLKGLPLPEKDRRILEAKVRQLALRMRLPRDGGDGGGNGPDPGDGVEPPRRAWRPPSGTISQTLGDESCICVAPRGNPGFLENPPGHENSLSGVNPLPALPAGKDFMNIFVLLWGWTPTLFSGPYYGPVGALLLRVEPGAPFGIGPSQMQVGLASEVQWAKEIFAWNLCEGKLASVQQNGPNSTPRFMLLTNECHGADTIVFAKPQLGGVWGDVANFEVTLFWTVFGGRRLTFTWKLD